MSQLTKIGEILGYGAASMPTNFLLCNGQAISRTTYAMLFAVIAPVKGTFSVTIATPAVVTLNGHGLVTGDAVFLTTTIALPTGLVANTIYYVIYIDANTFNLAMSFANAIAGTKIATSGSQSGVHTLTQCPYGLGDGSTTFNVPDMTGRMAVGYKSADANFGNIGSQQGSNTINLLHSHTQNANTHTISGNTSGPNTVNGGTNTSVTQPTETHTHSFTGIVTSAASDSGTNNQLSATQSVNNPFVVINFMIRYAVAAEATASFLLNFV